MKPQARRENQESNLPPSAEPLATMNRKQRREMTRKIQSEDISLEVVHPDAAALISATNPTTWPCRRTRDNEPVRRFRVHHGRTERDGRSG